MNRRGRCNAKTKATAIKARDILAKVASMPLTEREYKHDPRRRYFGPMAQDFHAAFGLGSDDKTINTLDADGVLFLSVKGLVEELKDRDARREKDLAEPDAKIDRLEKELGALRERISNLPPAR